MIACLCDSLVFTLKTTHRNDKLLAETFGYVVKVHNNFTLKRKKAIVPYAGGKNIMQLFNLCSYSYKVGLTYVVSEYVIHNETTHSVSSDEMRRLEIQSQKLLGIQ